MCPLQCGDPEGVSFPSPRLSRGTCCETTDGEVKQGPLHLIEPSKSAGRDVPQRGRHRENRDHCGLSVPFDRIFRWVATNYLLTVFNTGVNYHCPSEYIRAVYPVNRRRTSGPDDVGGDPVLASRPDFTQKKSFQINTSMRRHSSSMWDSTVTEMTGLTEEQN